MTRRDMVKTLAAGGAAVSAGCFQINKSSENGGGTMLRKPTIISRDPLPSTGPWPISDPFLFCVHHNDKFPAADGRLGPKDGLVGRTIGSDFSNRDGWSMYHGDRIPGFPRHPHRGFETVTIVQQGIVDHADSLGAAARYGQGDVQWLTAGHGINHAEMMPLFNTQAGNPLDLFQIWLNLPAMSKMVDPRFNMYWANQIPVVQVPSNAGRGTQIKVIAGRLNAQAALAPPADSYAADKNSEIAIWDIRIDAQSEWLMPASIKGITRSLYVCDGPSLMIDGTSNQSRFRYVLEPTQPVALRADKGPVRCLLLQGRPIGEPVAQHGPFVMNTREEIRQAIRDYQRTQFGGWPWTSNGPIHGLEPKRFARHADGRIEHPKG
ncbi:MAG: pirin family protein [Myxococcota bacterium]|nr:pirin family protein [Myxococcota bacterium]